MRTWKEYEAAGLARVECEPECDDYFEVFGDPDTKEERKEIENMMERHGCWWYAYEVRASKSDAWECGASLGMVIGDLEAVERESLQDEALSRLDELFSAAASELEERATYAAGGGL